VTNLPKVKHYPEPHCYPDKRHMILTACGIRVDERREIDYQEPNCKECAKRMEDYEKANPS
jgi:hypothetical protein